MRRPLYLSLAALTALPLAHAYTQCVEKCLSDNSFRPPCVVGDSSKPYDECLCNYMQNTNSKVTKCVNECPKDDQSTFADAMPSSCRKDLLPSAATPAQGETEDPNGDYPKCIQACVDDKTNNENSWCGGLTGLALYRCLCFPIDGDPMVSCMSACPKEQRSEFLEYFQEQCASWLFPNDTNPAPSDGTPSTAVATESLTTTPTPTETPGATETTSESSIPTDITTATDPPSPEESETVAKFEQNLPHGAAGRFVIPMWQLAGVALVACML